MKNFLQQSRTASLEGELVAQRPAPREDLVAALTRTIGAHPRQGRKARFGAAIAMAGVALVALGAGQAGYAYSSTSTPATGPCSPSRSNSPGSLPRRLLRPDMYTIRPLDASTWDAFAELVERNNGIFGGCWCIGYHPECGQKGISHRTVKEDRVRTDRAHAALVVDEDEQLRSSRLSIWNPVWNPPQSRRVRLSTGFPHLLLSHSYSEGVFGGARGLLAGR